MDEIIEGKHDDDAPLNSILTIGDIEQLTEEEAEAKLKEVLDILAPSWHRSSYLQIFLKQGYAPPDLG